MKKSFALLLIILLSITILTGCNTQEDHSDTDIDSDIITVSSETSEETPKNTDIKEEPFGGYNKSVGSLEELALMRELFYCTDEEKVFSFLQHRGMFKVEELLPFLNAVDYVPYVKTIDGEITRLYYTESAISSNKTFQIGTTDEKGDWVELLFYLVEEQLNDPVAYATEAASNRGGSLLAEPLESEDKRLTIISEQRENFTFHNLKNGIEWWGVLDGMA
ncbi:MAG: hypothetical protein J6M03_07795, partial [Clostridia bacterium]|nr:hypothetical protein [Clostridia bacterium]